MQKEGQGKKKANRLIHEKSPYLLQHAFNPVDWYPWNEEAFSKAKEEDKPVFVSIGYSTCHWCHVMEKESFEDDEVARLMNKAFVCIKIDREERPDLDSVYMTVCQIMGRNCGWPLNIIMTPEKNPFFAASYIPKDSRFGSSGMLDLIPQISQIWKSQRADLENLGKELRQKIESFEKRTPDNELGKNDIQSAYEKLSLRFDAEHGGFGSAPKFPTPHNLLFLLRYWNRSKEKKALDMVLKTLDSMRAGGIFDQIGFGFHRYSTDGQWLVPHFEKMLYDQAMLALAYLEAYQATGSPRFRVTAKEVLDYVLRDMTAPDGGFYSAEDADSEGEEGKFYVWTEEEVRSALPSEESEIATLLFGISLRGNFSERGENPSGKNILHLTTSFAGLAGKLQMPVDVLISKIAQIQRTLLSTREKRVHPERDDKVLTDWNGLMIAALARAGRVLEEKKFLDAAIKATNFVQQKLKTPEGVLWHRYAKGERAIQGFLDDYAFFAWGLVEVYQASLEESFKEEAFSTIGKMIEFFWDEREGGFYFTDKYRPAELPLQKQVYDGALPSGNSVALLDLLIASRLYADPRFEDMASRMSKTFAGEIRESPAAHTFFLAAIDFAIGPTYNVTLVGDQEEKDMKIMLNQLRENYLPHAVLLLKPPERTGLGFEQIGGNATAYICRNKTCFASTNKTDRMLELLEISKNPVQ